jgi:predicted nucleic acid-binding protein
MKYVLDANIGLKTALPKPDAGKALALIADFQQQIRELIAPDTYLVECGHALTRAERKGLIQPPEGFEKMVLIATTRPQLYSHIPLLSRAFELSSLMRHGLYDCLYIALAEREGCQLVTADEKLRKAFPANAISLDQV